MLVALADHGLTPSAIAARLTLTGAPESVQGALAAGLLGGGSRFLGVTEDAGRFLADALADRAGRPARRRRRLGRPCPRRRPPAHDEAGLVPGLGHPVHKDGDPRTPVMVRIAEEEGLRGPHLRLFEAVGPGAPRRARTHPAAQRRGRRGAALCDLGFSADILRGFALLARTAGLLGHLAEEMRQPVGLDIYRDVDQSIRYQPRPQSP